MISEEDIRKVKDATDIVALVSERVILRQKGRKFWGCCPFHNERTPSFQVDPETQLYHCFGCGVGGDSIGYLMQSDNMPFMDAIQTLALRAGIEIEDSRANENDSKRNRLVELCDATAAFYHAQLMRTRSQEAQSARDYLAKRALGSEIASKWQLGYAPGRTALVNHLQSAGFSSKEMIDANVALASNGRLRDRFYERVMFPIHDLAGHAIAFGGRIIKAGEPKYLNSSDTQLFHKRHNLFAMDFAKEQIVNSKLAIVVEGYIDVIAMHRAGFTNTVATLGTALTAQHVKLLARFSKKIVLLFDGDTAGRKAAFRAHELASQILNRASVAGNAEVLIGLLPEGLDPSDFLDEQAPQAMQSIISGALPLLQYAIDSILASIDTSSVDQRNHALNQVLDILKPIDAPLIVDDYLGYLAKQLHVDVDTVLRAFAVAKSVERHKGLEQAAQPSEATDAQKAHDNNRMHALEMQMFGLFVQSEAVRPLLTKAFAKIAFSSKSNSKTAKTLIAASEQSQVPIIQYLYSNLPEAGVINETVAEIKTEDPIRLGNRLLWQLKIQQLEVEIKSMQSILRKLDSNQGSDYDEAFAKVVKLQKDLSQAHKNYSALETITSG